MKNLTYILFLIFALSFKQNTFANVEIVSDSTKLKSKYSISIEGLYLPYFIRDFESGTGRIVLLGFTLEKHRPNSKITQVTSFFNSYYWLISDEEYIITRYNSLTYGFNYNFLKKNKLSLGLQSGLFLFESPKQKYGLFHSYGITFMPKLEYQYNFKKFSIGINTMLPLNIGKYQMPAVPLIDYTPNEFEYNKGFGINYELFLNLTFTKNL